MSEKKIEEVEFSDEVKKAIRQRHGILADDSSMDETILRGVSPEAALRDICAWSLGSPIWSETFARWARGCGFEITIRKGGSL